MNRDLFAAAGSTAVGIPDSYFNSNVLLLTGDGTNGAQNNTVLDSSGNNLVLTRGGAISQGSVSPFSKTGWSAQFNGTSDYLTIANNAAHGTFAGDFTIECWFYLNKLTGIQRILGHRTGTTGTAGYVPFIFWTDVASLKFFASSDNGTWNVANNIALTTVTAGQWYHLAYTRSGSSCKIFLNGVNVYSFTNSSTFSTANELRIGGSDFLQGNISNVRIVNGTAVYTTTFTPSTVPLTVVTNTSLLTLQSNRFVDNSSNNFAVTVVSTTSIQPFSPFAPTSAYNSATDGGSLYFNPNSNTNAVYQDFLSTPANTALTLGTDNFTLEFWIYRNTTASTTVLFDSSTVGYLGFWITATQIVPFNTTTTTFPITYSIVNNSWNHIAVVRAGTGTNQTTAYVNGIAVGTTTIPTNFSASTGTVIIGKGSANVNYMNGYISNLRLVKGTAIYTSNFTPPTSPLTAISGTSLLLRGTNAGIIDSTTKFNPVTQGDAKISTAVVKYHTGSMIFDGTGDFLTIPTSNILQFGTGPFTVEFWMYPTNVTGDRGIFGLHLIGSISSLAIRISTGRMSYWFSNSPNVSTGTATTINVNQWYHIAFVRTMDATNNIRCYINGVSEAGLTSTNTSHSIPVLAGVIGRAYYDSDNFYFMGYLDDLRVTRGVARYTADFTPPTVPFAAF